MSRKKRKKKKTAENKKIKRRVIYLFILEIIISIVFNYYIIYQNSNMNNFDSDLIVRAYFLLDDFSNEMQKSINQEDSEESSLQNIKYLALSMSSYSNKNSKDTNTIEGQKLLNKYYKMIGQLGMNATKDSSLFYGNKNNINEQYESDLKRLKDVEKDVFEYYKVNENALSNQK